MGRLLLTLSAVLLFMFGLSGLFAPDHVAASLAPPNGPAMEIVIQVAASAMLGLAILDWMSRGNRIGGIYARPTGLANLLFFMAAGLSIDKAAAAGKLPASAVIVGVIFSVLALAFAWLVFAHDPLGASPES